MKIEDKPSPLRILSFVEPIVLQDGWALFFADGMGDSVMVNEQLRKVQKFEERSAYTLGQVYLAGTTPLSNNNHSLECLADYSQ
jgi:hypothetical protein